MQIMLFAILVACVLVGSLIPVLRKRHLQAISDTSDKDFGEFLRIQFNVDPDEAIAQRREISKVIGVPTPKLAPQMRLTELPAGVLDSTHIGLTDLEFELSSMAKAAGVRERILMPATVAEIVKLRSDLAATIRRLRDQ